MEARIDKFLWSVRLFKTRSKAAEACKKGQIFISGSLAKASRYVKTGDSINIKRPPVTYSFEVLDIPFGRLGARFVENYIKHTTSPDQLALLEVIKLDKQNQRAKGLGRPTKKDRRDIDDFLGQQPYFINEDDVWEF